MHRKAIAIVLATLVVGAATGCSSLYSHNRWGPQADDLLNVDKGTTQGDVLRALGMPDRQVTLPDGRDAFLYRSWKGLNILMVYTSAERNDTLYIFDDEGKVAQRIRARTGEGVGIFGLPWPVLPVEPTR